MAAVKKNRELSENKDTEMQLESGYVKVSGKEAESDNDYSDYDNCDLDELNDYDNAAGVTEINSVSNENTPSGVDILGVTNITPV